MSAAARTHRSRAIRPLATLATFALLGVGAILPAAADDDLAASGAITPWGVTDDGVGAVTETGDPERAQEGGAGFTPMLAEVDGVFLSEVYFRPGDADDFIEIAAEPGTDVSGWVVGSTNRAGQPQNAGVNVVIVEDGTVVPENGILDVQVPITNAVTDGWGASPFVITADGEIAAFYTIGFCSGGAACDEQTGGVIAGSGDSVPAPLRGLTGTPTEEIPPSGLSLQWVDGEWASGVPSRGEPNEGDDDPGEPGEPETLEIHEVWGVDNGTAVTTTGVVTGHYPVGGFNGYTIQTAGTGAAGPAGGVTSHGIFVFSASTVGQVELGDRVEVTGERGEFNGLHQIVVNTSVDWHGATVLDGPFEQVTAVADFVLPAEEEGRLAHQSMLVHPADRYVVSDTFQLGGFGDTRFGSIGLGLDGPLVQESELANPRTAPDDYAELIAENQGRAVTLDDGQSARTPFGADVPYLTDETNVRTGVGLTFEQSVIVDYRFQWNFQPTEPVTGNADHLVSFGGGDTREANATPADVGGDVTVAIFNVLNYFTTLGDTAGFSCTSYDDREGNPLTVNTCTNPNPGPRGAWDAAALAWQQGKIVTAINGLDADVVALSEIENSAHFSDDRDASLAILVDALNDAAGEERWAFADSPQEVPGLEDDDVIRNAFIYQTAVVETVGAGRILLGDDAYHNAREPLAQGFGVIGTEYEFLAVVNHFKSKSCSGYDGEDLGQGCWNGDRIAQAQSLVDFADEVAGQEGIEDVFLMGDFNSYSAEDPLQVFAGADYENANPAVSYENYDGENTYVFGGRVGSLDHIFMSESVGDRHAGTEVWSINANESVLAEYSRHNYFASSHFEEGIPFRSSDHDPVIIGIDLPEPVEPPELVDLSILSFNDLHGRIGSPQDDLGDPAIASAMACLIEDYREANENTLLVSGGDNIGATTFTSFIDQDFPTLNVLNAFELDVSVLGNHEFDQGQVDVDDRVIPYSEFPWIAANIVDDDGEPVYDPYIIVESGGLNVAFVGAITEDMPRLVTPSGIEDLTFTSMSEAINTHAAELSDSGAADVIIAVVHEGLPTPSLNSADGTPFGDLLDDAHESISAIISGHTHLQYAHNAEGMWVTQAGQYGEAMGVLDLTIDPVTAEVVDSDARNVPIDPVGPQDCALGTHVLGIVDAARENAEELGSVEIGTATDAFNRAQNSGGGENRGGESVLGALVADAQLWSAQRTHPEAQIAFTNSGGLRADLSAGPVTVRDAGNIQPFANTLVSVEVTGTQLAQVLEEQWREGEFSKLAQSSGFRYLYDPEAEPGERISAMFLDGEPIDAEEYYTVVVNSHMAAGGSGMVTLPQGRNIADTGQSDLDAMVEFIQDQETITPDYSQRVVGVRWISDPEGVYAPGDEIAIDVSSFVFTAGEPVPDVLQTSLAGVSTGSFDLDASPVNNTDEAGRAEIRMTVPQGVPEADEHSLEIVDETNGTVVTLPVTVAADPPGDPVEALDELADSLAGYVEDGAIDGPIARQLQNALDQAQRHVDGGRTAPAVQALERFVRHLDNPKRPDTLTEEAASDLREQAVAILDLL